MTYHAGLGVGFGVAPRDPHVTCDECSLVETAVTRSGGPKAWILNRKAPPGWLLIRDEGPPLFRRDYCPRCKAGKKKEQDG